MEQPKRRMKIPLVAAVTISVLTGGILLTPTGQRGVLGFLLVITVKRASKTKNVFAIFHMRYRYFDEYTYASIKELQILIALFLFLSIFIRFKFVKDDGCLKFQGRKDYSFMNTIYKKALIP